MNDPKIILHTDDTGLITQISLDNEVTVDLYEGTPHSDEAEKTAQDIAREIASLDDSWKFHCMNIIWELNRGDYFYTLSEVLSFLKDDLRDYEIYTDEDDVGRELFRRYLGGTEEQIKYLDWAECIDWKKLTQDNMIWIDDMFDDADTGTITYVRYRKDAEKYERI